MRIDIRWQLLLAAICLALVISILGFQYESAGPCTTRVPTSGGALVHGLIGQPQYLNPILSHSNPVDADLSSLIFDGLTRPGSDGQLEPALAKSWQFSEDGRSITFELRDDISWHDGQPFTAADVAYTYSLLKDEALPISDSLRSLWQSVTISMTSDIQLEFSLPEPYGPFLQAATLGILPEHLLGDVPAGDLSSQAFNRSPVGTGPFLVVPGTDWQRTGSVRLAPNPAYWPQGTQLDTLDFRFFADSDALLRAVERGEIQAVIDLPKTINVEIGSLPNMRLFSSAAPIMTELLFNLSSTAPDPIQMVEVRKALAYALDRDAIIDQALGGQGLLLEGPFPPDSWAYDPGLLTSYTYQPDTAETMLDQAGWTRNDGATIRNKDDQSLNVRLLLSDNPNHQAVAQVIVDAWARVGVSTVPIVVDPAALQDALLAKQYDAALVDIELGSDPDLYDFWSQEAIVRGQNYGSWNDRWASEALENARRLTSTDDRRPFYTAFLQTFNDQLPALTLYQHVQTFALDQAVKQAEIGKVRGPRDRYKTLRDWFLLYRDVAVACPETEV